MYQDTTCLGASNKYLAQTAPSQRPALAYRPPLSRPSLAVVTCTKDTVRWRPPPGGGRIWPWLYSLPFTCCSRCFMAHPCLFVPNDMGLIVPLCVMRCTRTCCLEFLDALDTLFDHEVIETSGPDDRFVACCFVHSAYHYRK
jgi:hypothetical protein